MRLQVLALLAPLLAITTVSSAWAAESYDNCTGFIDSLPATIGTQGVWCLRQDLSTGMTSGGAIVVGTNNVTIDCNDFKIGGLGGGAATQASGIRAVARQNAVVRRCNLRGFLRGVEFTGAAGGGHVVHDNRFSGITGTGLHVEGEGSVVQRNLLTDTGGSTFDGSAAVAIFTSANVDVIANTISGVLPLGGGSGNGIAYGIRTSANTGGTVAGNRIRGLVPAGTGAAFGISNTGSGRLVLRANDVVGTAVAGSVGLACANSQGVALENVVSGFATGIQGCSNEGNVVKP